MTPGVTLRAQRLPRLPRAKRGGAKRGESNLLAHIVIASEAKQSPRLARGLLRRCAPRNDTDSHLTATVSARNKSYLKFAFL